MGRQALPADDDRRSGAGTVPTTVAPVTRARGRRAAAGPSVARSTWVAHERPARVVTLSPARTAHPVADPVTGTLVSRTAALRAERAADPRHVRRAATARRAALLIAPALAVTSTLSLSIPAEAATAAPAAVPTTTSLELQTYTVAHDVEVPITSSDGVTTTSVVSYPTLVLRFGVTEAQAQSALSAALSAGGDRATVLQTALQYLGDPYLEGGADHAGIDCSGLTMVAYQAVGIELAHYVPTQDAAAETVPESEAAPGDLVVFDDEDHVGLYLGQGLVLQAPHPGEVVDIVPMYSMPHHFARLLPAGS
ncbi:C40 family peptidase [Curtobacterium sp. MCSS17_015]|uniref:C40 family peptidase n=1 Tax=Curtobacterium sp. MCSS17_015 TaxID=2175666 RepID=UPI000DA79C8C|nr:C40 family peptidase [Curtobacterium sp. MCSS17_015]WIB27531.1 C40 family peptidase [Curtobacterium sp. MCSS17_015]